MAKSTKITKSKKSPPTTTDTGKPKHPGGRPTKFSDQMKDRIKALILKGLTDNEICHAVGVEISTLTRWKQNKPEFFIAVKDWKNEADHEIEKSLYMRAHGYYHPETKAQWVNDETGGRWETIEMVKHYPPDATSMIFWLKNRQPQRWRDVHDINVSQIDDIVRDLEGED